MALVDAVTLQRLRREESEVDQQCRQAANVAKMLKDFPQHAIAQQKADALRAKVASLREQIIKIEAL
jgi:polyhydroxyalkanoate synthesis regulator phasin